MSQRVALAIREYVRGMGGDRKYLLMEATEKSIADSLREVWSVEDEALPVLAVLEANDPSPVSVAQLRNDSARGVLVVTVLGAEVAEAQSIRGFVSISPERLLASRRDLMFLANHPIPVSPDGEMVPIREAIVALPAGQKPRALRVSDFFDAVVGGADPLQSLPILGGFRDTVDHFDLRSDRIYDNLLLAQEVLSGVFSSTKELGVIRPRALRAFRATRKQPAKELEAFMRLLEAQAVEILSAITYTEAVEIFRKKSASLGEEVKYERDVHINSNPDDTERLEPVTTLADDVDRGGEAAAGAAETILLLDEEHEFLTPPTRKRLYALLKDRKVSSSGNAIPSIGIAKAISMLDSAPTSIELLEPLIEVDDDAAGDASDAIVALAAFNMLSMQVFEFLAEREVEVDFRLAEMPWRSWDLNDISAALADMSDGDGRRVVVRVASATSSVEVQWAPNLEILALMRVMLEFAGLDCLHLRMTPELQGLRGIAQCRDFTANALIDERLNDLSSALTSVAVSAIRGGLKSADLSKWSSSWVDFIDQTSACREGHAGQSALLAGSIFDPSRPRSEGIWLSPLSPPKSMWLADFFDACDDLVGEALSLVESSELVSQLAFDTGEQALASVTSAGIPGFLRLVDDDKPVLPNVETRLWSHFAGRVSSQDDVPFSVEALSTVVRRLMRLQPEVTSHFKCLADGPESGALLLEVALEMLGSKVDGQRVTAIDLTMIGDPLDAHPVLDAALERADRDLRSGENEGALNVRFVSSLSSSTLESSELPQFHFGLVVGPSAAEHARVVGSVEIEMPESDSDVLFTPRVWQRPDREHRLLLVSPGLSDAGATWLRLCHSMEDRWPQSGERISVPEIRLGLPGVGEELRRMHQLALWVGVLDKFVTRDGLERALPGEIAILHQERRFGTESPMGLVVSQMAGGPVDRAIGRSLRMANIVQDEDLSFSIGSGLRKIAAQGYGILALEAATSGTGINELVGHVVGFSLLGTKTTPWPLPAGCRVLMVSLDDNPDWFKRSKRADLVALALDTTEGGVHGAVIEVKARRSSASHAGREAVEQLRRTLISTAYVFEPDPEIVASRVWLNRLAEAAYAVARESRIRLTSEEMRALEQFRRGQGTLEWGGLGLVFGPDLDTHKEVHRQELMGDWVPIVIEDIPLTQSLLIDSLQTDLSELYTQDAGQATLGGGRRVRRPEAKPKTAAGESMDDSPVQETQIPVQGNSAGSAADQDVEVVTAGDDAAIPVAPATPLSSPINEFIPPLLGWDTVTKQEVHWYGAGSGSNALSNGHIQVWGSSGAGKTQFMKMLLAQLVHLDQACFGIADFKNDYSPEAGMDFLEATTASFIDMWGRPGAPFNPLELEDGDDLDARIIEFRDAVEQAAAAYLRIGPRQKAAIEKTLRTAYKNAGLEGRRPTMRDVNTAMDDSIEHILNDLTRYEIFSTGPNLSSALEQRLVFGLNKIPGDGQTTTLAAAFLLADLAAGIQKLQPIANAIRYVAVVDEAHRVSKFKALDLMIREGRSKGLAVFLATQSPADLPEVVDTNAQTRICFRLSDAVVATQAARKLNSKDEALASRIQNLESGQAYVSLGGKAPKLIDMVQFFRDREALLD